MPFLNEVLGKDLPDKLTHVEVRGEEQSMYAEGQYHIYHDVHARDANGNAYVIEMERACQVYDVVRFQYTATRVFVKSIEARFWELREKAEEEAEAKTNEAKAAVAKAAEAKAKAEKANSAEVRAAEAKAIEEVTEARPKLVGNQIF